MSRHRNLKYMEDEYDDYDDEYGASPSPANESYLSEYMYKRGQQQQQQQQTNRMSNNATATTNKSSKFETDTFLVKDCMDYILDILGGESQTEFTKEEIEDAIRKNMYDADVALDYLYDLKERKLKQKSKTPSSPIGSNPTSKDKAQDTIFQFDEPSPDDLAIQGREGKKVQKQADKAPNFKPIQKKKDSKKSKQSTQKENKINPQPTILVVKSEKQVKKTTTPIGTVKSKPVQDIDKERVNVVVIGHVDAGKSTLMGHVLVALGHVPDRLLHKYKKESQEMGKGSFAFAWVFDENEEERARGVTIDVGIRHFETEKRHVTILDAPGHRDFVPNMITGASQADIAILVVDSSTGEFESGFKSGGQTKEHLVLAKSLGISEIIVAVNKLDNVQWDQSRFDYISQELGKFIRHIGYKDDDVKYIPCSGLLGENLTSKSKNPELQSWYQSKPCLIEAVDNAKLQKRDAEKGLRLSIADFYKPQHTGAAVNLCGKIESGHVSVNDKIIIMPIQEECQVKTISRNKKNVNSAFAGDNVEIGVNGIDIDKVQVGQILCDIFDRVRIFRRFRASVIIFDTPLPLIKGSQCVLHIHHSNVSCVISRLLSIVDKNFEVIQKRPRALTKNVTANIEIICEYPICAELYSEHKSFGRFTLRQEGQTIAAGMITKIKKDKKKKNLFSSEGVEEPFIDVNKETSSTQNSEDEPIFSSDIPQTTYLGDEEFDFM